MIYTDSGIREKLRWAGQDGLRAWLRRTDPDLQSWSDDAIDAFVARRVKGAEEADARRLEADRREAGGSVEEAVLAELRRQ